ncbi:MAG: PAS domain S-box protein [Bacteroidota bacterium]
MDQDFSDIIESVSEGLLVLSDKGRIVYANPSAFTLFRYTKEEILRKTIEDLVPPPRYQKNQKKTLQIFINGLEKRPTSKRHIFEAIAKDGTLLKVAIGLNYTRNNQGKISIMVTVADCTEQEKLLKKFEKEQLKALQYLELSKSIFLVLDREGKVKLINPEGLKVFEYEEPEIINMNWFENFVQVDDQDWLHGVFNKIMQEDITGVEFVQSNVICKSGTIKLIEWHNSIIYDENGKPDGTISSGVDVTVREQNEKFRTEAILKGIEQERKRIAGELHDGLVQTLSAVSLNLKTLENAIQTSSHNDQKAFNDALNLLELAIADTRRLSHDLMPSTIERYGLIKTLRDFASRMTKLSELKVEIDPDHVDDDLSEFLRLNIYRIIQELVQNVIKHAGARSIFIKIRKFNHSIRLTVEDDGVGFKGSIEEISHFGIGLKNVMARIKSMDGSFRMESKEKLGTHIDISIPVLH